ncbi:MAG TPA: metal ABC transporter permease [Kiritimatiellia bacterium]|nr:metal ABC transporter permease [Kiritimatiellia bacterium]
MELWHSVAGALPFEWARYVFMQNALLAVLLISPLFALLGCMVVQNQMSFFSEAVGHAALTGIAVGVLVGLGDPLWSMLAVAILLALGVSAMRRWSAASTDTVIGLTMAFTVALGVALLSRGGGFAKYSRFLVGDVLTITPHEIVRLVVALGVVLAVWIFGFNRLFFVSLNRSLARSRGMPVWMVETGFAVIVALAVTVSIQWVGLLVINSLLILPAATARNLARDVPRYVGMAVALSLFSGVVGLVVSFYAGTATGATMVLVAMACFVASLPVRLAGFRI